MCIEFHKEGERGRSGERGSHWTFLEVFSEVALSRTSTGVLLLLRGDPVLEDVAEVDLLRFRLGLRECSCRVNLSSSSSSPQTLSEITAIQTCAAKREREGEKERERRRERRRERGEREGERRKRRRERERERGKRGENRREKIKTGYEQTATRAT